MCLLSAIKSKMNNFLQSYKTKLTQQNRFNDKDLQTVLSAVVLLLRRHSINNQLCCQNNYLEVTRVDSYGFVTEARCKKCDEPMETTCYDGKWTYERIYDEQKLNPGDHICWHRPYCIWHHAIVTTVEPEIKVIHYNDLKVQEKAKSEVDSFCNTLYRINYHDCYDIDYSILRARKLLNESRYDLLARNCEHFVRWCKTGSTSSSQTGIFWVSLGKAALMIGLRVIALLILGLLQYSHEEAEENVKDRQRFESLERWIAAVYILIVTMIFIIYFISTSGSRLHPVRMKGHNIENPCSCLDLYDKCTKDGSGFKRYICCCCLSCYSLCCRALSSLFFCKHIKRSPCTCFRRPCNLACGLFWRIVIRESTAALGTLLVVMLEEEITNADGIAGKSTIERTVLFLFFSALVHGICYAGGSFLGRLFEACCDCHTRSNAIESSTPITAVSMGPQLSTTVQIWQCQSQSQYQNY